MNTENKTRIDQYLKSNSDVDTHERFPISLKGIKKMLNVYRLPTNMLFYNIRNGRFAAEYGEMIRNEGGHLDPEKESDAEKIRRLLLEINEGEMQRTCNDLKIRGQWNCGIITEDGYMIDGNRRKAIMSKLYEETGKKEWEFIKVARLDESITSEDLWTLEAGIQLGKDEIVRYGPINELLKIREGIKAGLTKKAIVSALYGYDKEEEIHEKMERLDMIDQYLKFIGSPDKYSKVKNRAEHFIDLQRIIKECENRDYEVEKIMNIKRFAFQLIKENIQHIDIRKIKQMVTKDLDDAIECINNKGADLKPTIPRNSTSEEIIEENVTDVVNEFDSEEEEEISPTHVKFINAVDILDVSNSEGEEIRLLGRAEKNLKPLADYQDSNISDPEAISLFKKIESHVADISKKITR